MAITSTHYQLLKELKQRGELPICGTILEIGEANWYGDLDPYIIADDSGDEHIRRAIERSSKLPDHRFWHAKLAYTTIMAPTETVSIDMTGPNALQLDLNWPIDLHRTFDLCVNHGTAEHVFNIANVFRVMHEHTSDGGLMIHESPFYGWVDHGFYCLQPTLYYDLIAANGYSQVMFAMEDIDSQTIVHAECREHIHHIARQGKLPANAMLFVAYRKHGNEIFRIPQQGYYAETLSPAAEAAWMELR